MRSISVPDFCARPEEVLDGLREKEVPYLVTLAAGGEPVALLSPLEVSGVGTAAAQKPAAPGAGWADYSRLAEDLRDSWPADRDSTTLLRAMRGGGP